MSTRYPPIEFRRVAATDRAQILAIAERTWEGHDYLPAIFDAWVADRRSYFGALVQDGRLIGCGRLFPFDARRGWLEALRIHPDHQRQGLGRELARHVMSRAVAMGLRELLFSTYFDNVSSIRISEQFGFRRFALFTNLELGEVCKSPARAAEVSPESGIEVRPGIPPADELMANDWFFVPPGVAERVPYFPNAVTLRGHDCQLLLAEARRRRRAHVHLMLPDGYALEPFQQAGFRYHERERDVWLYAARTADLRL